MKAFDQSTHQADPVIREVWRTKREIMTEHGGDIDSLFADLRNRQSKNPRLVKTKTGARDAAGNPN